MRICILIELALRRRIGDVRDLGRVSLASYYTRLKTDEAL
jgi:hypothetical protein